MPALALHQHMRPAAGVDGDFFLLDLRFLFEAGSCGLLETGGDAVAVDDAGILVDDFRHKPDPRLLVSFQPAAPMRGQDAALLGDHMGKTSVRRRLDELQRTIEVGLAGAVRADKQIDRPKIHPDRLQRPVVLG